MITNEEILQMSRKQLVYLRDLIDQRLHVMPNARCQIRVISEPGEDENSIARILDREIFAFEKQHGLTMIERSVVKQPELTKYEDRDVHLFDIEWQSQRIDR